ncbi:hypothetical protein BW730_12320 [Tessaracoccus aquimaris]|uniref:HTH tetR-type domain-containing protein n=2 Tax=Tessaracoccus aquimaris TaxID=1332264 RepID=A0A1Q2CQ27_9ACTN|nr:hypothetical protein BW730_12320 [Tessaracoccus aquimaris]
MPPEKRRAAIIKATLPLIEQHGTTVTTRQVAEAAGVAEGTIFRVFDSLQELIDAAIMSAFSREKLLELLHDVDLGADLEAKTNATLGLLAQRLDTIRALMMVIHHAHGQEEHKPDTCIRDELDLRRRELDAWLAARFDENAEELRVSPTQYVSFLRLLATGTVLHLDTGIDAAATASLALHGALRKEPN